MATRQLVTYASMRSTNGSVTIYHVYRGVLNTPQDRKPYINLNAKSTKVLTAIADRDGTFCYRCAEEKNATPTAPPVPWSEHRHSLIERLS